MPDPDDATLVQRIRSGDQQAETALIERYSLGVWAILARWRVRGAIEAADLYQETWDIVLRKIRAGDTRSPDAIRSFISSTARFVLNGAFRREKRREHGPMEDIADPMPPTWMMLDARFRARLVRRFLNELPSGHRDLLLMYFVSEYSREEICARLDISSEQLSRRLYSAKAAFREFLSRRMPSLGLTDD